MNPTRQVVLALIVSGVVFVAAGNSAYTRAGKVGSLLSGTATGTSLPPIANPRVIFGWAVLSVFLIIGSELPGMGDLSVAFAWLIAIGLFLTLGGAAFSNLSSILAGTPVSGGGGASSGHISNT